MHQTRIRGFRRWRLIISKGELFVISMIAAAVVTLVGMIPTFQVMSGSNNIVDRNLQSGEFKDIADDARTMCNLARTGGDELDNYELTELRFEEIESIEFDGSGSSYILTAYTEDGDSNVKELEGCDYSFTIEGNAGAVSKENAAVWLFNVTVTGNEPNPSVGIEAEPVEQ